MVVNTGIVHNNGKDFYEGWLTARYIEAVEAVIKALALDTDLHYNADILAGLIVGRDYREFWRMGFGLNNGHATDYVARVVSDFDTLCDLVPSQVLKAAVLTLVGQEGAQGLILEHLKKKTEKETIV